MCVCRRQGPGGRSGVRVGELTPHRRLPPTAPGRAPATRRWRWPGCWRRPGQRPGQMRWRPPGPGPAQWLQGEGQNRRVGSCPPARRWCGSVARRRTYPELRPERWPGRCPRRPGRQPEQRPAARRARWGACGQGEGRGVGGAHRAAAAGQAAGRTEAWAPPWPAWVMAARGREGQVSEISRDQAESGWILRGAAAEAKRCPAPNSSAHCRTLRGSLRVGLRASLEQLAVGRCLCRLDGARAGEQALVRVGCGATSCTARGVWRGRGGLHGSALHAQGLREGAHAHPEARRASLPLPTRPAPLSAPSATPRQPLPISRRGPNPPPGVGSRRPAPLPCRSAPQEAMGAADASSARPHRRMVERRGMLEGRALFLGLTAAGGGERHSERSHRASQL